mmetsp:Transcript_16060/g.52284  ORF Transcript_16060/g.52284 Transcript_16060/m.52284 type:complete len:250 (+) Transcript_16060:1-750(+)
MKYWSRRFHHRDTRRREGPRGRREGVGIQAFGESTDLEPHAKEPRPACGDGVDDRRQSPGDRREEARVGGRGSLVSLFSRRTRRRRAEESQRFEEVRRRDSRIGERPGHPGQVAEVRLLGWDSPRGLGGDRSEEARMRRPRGGEAPGDVRQRRHIMEGRFFAGDSSLEEFFAVEDADDRLEEFAVEDADGRERRGQFPELAARERAGAPDGKARDPFEQADDLPCRRRRRQHLHTGARQGRHRLGRKIF